MFAAIRENLSEGTSKTAKKMKEKKKKKKNEIYLVSAITVTTLRLIWRIRSSGSCTSKRVEVADPAYIFGLSSAKIS
jgi:hypothetical protein